MVFYWGLGAVAFGIPIVAAVLYARRPRLGARILAGWVALLGTMTLVVIGTTLTAVAHAGAGAKTRAVVAIVLVLALFATLSTGLWRGRRWALLTMGGLLGVVALTNVFMAFREHARLETATIVSYLTVLPAVLFMSFRALRRRPADAAA